MKRILLGLAVAYAALAVSATPAAAQTTASDAIQVTGTVAGALTVAAGNDLVFGVIIPGLARAVLPTDPGAGTFLVNGEPGAGVQLTFPALPTEITGPGADIPLTLSLVYNTANDATTGTTIDPSTVTPTTALSAGVGGGDLFIFLGGTVSPAVGQTAGSYANTFTLQAMYVNN